MKSQGQTPVRPLWPAMGFICRRFRKFPGSDFMHQAPALDAKLEPIMPEVASMGASASIVDFDRDGWQDILRCEQRHRQQECALSKSWGTALSKMWPPTSGSRT